MKSVILYDILKVTKIFSEKEIYMKLRAPSIPLITVDPYFSVWAPHEKLNFRTTRHWTGAENPIFAEAIVDGERASFLGYERESAKMTETELDIDALSTRATFENGKIRLFVKLMTPLIPDDLALLTRPVSYMILSYESMDGEEHDVRISVKVRDNICLNRGKESPVEVEKFNTSHVHGIRMGNSVQKPLNRSGDDLRIDWGYFYLGADGDGVESEYDVAKGWHPAYVRIELPLTKEEERRVLFAYDDCESICYFGKHLKSYWNKDGESILSVMDKAISDFCDINARCDAFSDALIAEAYLAGGEKYADLLSLAYRQVIAAHKVAVDENGEILFISKECFSNGCAATVDVSYPSTPMLLRYNPELVKGMMRPIYKFAESDGWKYDFAPHDAGQYPLVNGQVYGKDKATGELKYESQMPVEECGNMIIMETCVALAEGNADFAASHFDTLVAWCEYLKKYGDDPENQLCTDDFAGHLAHNCNLAVKAIMGIAGMSILCDMLDKTKEAKKYKSEAKKKAESWCKRAANGDGSYRLAFDRDGSFSMKYNMVWDKIWGTGIFPREVYKREVKSNFNRFNEYGMPLDSRSDYTKSDWLVWTATLASSDSDFKKFIAPLWKAYNETPDRVPMTDWYDTVSGMLVGFIHRTVQGGLFIKLLDKSGILKVKK